MPEERSSEAGGGCAVARPGSWGARLSFLRDDVAVVGERDEGIDLALREPGCGVVVEVAADEAVGDDTPVQGGGTRSIDDGGPVFLGEGKEAKDAVHPALAAVLVDAAT